MAKIARKLPNGCAMRSPIRPKDSTIAPEKLTVAQYLQVRWLPDVRLQVDVSSYLQYEAHVRRILPALGNIVLARLSAPDVQKLYTDMAEQYAAGDDSPDARDSV